MEAALHVLGGGVVVCAGKAVAVGLLALVMFRLPRQERWRFHHRFGRRGEL